MELFSTRQFLQSLKIREVLGKNDYVGMDFVGVRAHESATRATYDEENFGKKQKGQYSHNPILEWTSAEIWLYIFSHNLPINNTYKKGNSRAGCLFCPMGGGKSDSFRYLCYKNEIDKYTDIIRDKKFITAVFDSVSDALDKAGIAYNGNKTLRGKVVQWLSDDARYINYQQGRYLI